MAYRQANTSNVIKPVSTPIESDYSGHKKAETGLPSPTDNFANVETIKKTTAKVSNVKAKDLSGSLKASHGPAGATAWEMAGDAKKNPSIRSFHGSKPNRVKK
jgi:hypothetical protein